MAFRKTVQHEPEIRLVVAEPQPHLRDEVDPDPLVEAMVQRLRDGLRSMVAVDAWGREMAWRNVLRMALGPAAARLRDADTSAVLAEAVAERAVLEPQAESYVPETPVDAAPEPVPAAAEVQIEPLVEPEPSPEPSPEAEMVVEATVEPVAEPLPEPVAEAVVEPFAAPEVEPEPEVLTPVSVPTTIAPTSTYPVLMGTLQQFTLVPAAPSADETPVSAGTFDASQFAGGSRPSDLSATQYDRFLASLYGKGEKVGAHEDGGPGGSSLSDDGESRVNP